MNGVHNTVQEVMRSGELTLLAAHQERFWGSFKAMWESLRK